LCPYLFNQDGNFRNDFAASAWFCRGHHTTPMPVKSKLIAYRVYLSAASMKVGKELDKSFQIIIGTIHALMN